MLSFFVVIFDSWSIQRRQLQNTPLVDQFHSAYLSIALFCSVLIPSICSLRMQSIRIAEEQHRLSAFNMGSVNFEDWLIVVLLLTHYLSLLLNERRIFAYTSYRLMHRKRRICLFSAIAIQTRLRSVLFLFPLFVLTRFLGAPLAVTTLFPVLIAITIIRGSYVTRFYRRLYSIYQFIFRLAHNSKINRA